MKISDCNIRNAESIKGIADDSGFSGLQTDDIEFICLDTINFRYMVFNISRSFDSIDMNLVQFVTV